MLGGSRRGYDGGEQGSSHMEGPRMSPEEFQAEVLRRFDVIDERLDRIESEQSSLRQQVQGLTNTVDRMYDVLVDHGRPDPRRRRETSQV